MTTIPVTGFDPSMKNWGVVRGQYDLVAETLSVEHVSVINPVLPTGKQVRQNSRDLEAAQQLAKGCLAAVEGAHAIFVEVPHGSQSARAMASYGLCVGVLGGLRAAGIPFIEVTATEVKMIATGRKSATKNDMIEWAIQANREADWPYYTRNGVLRVSEAKAEHMADALAAIYAGIRTNAFQSMLPFFKSAIAS